MLQRVRNFAVRLHKDERGPNTVEWLLLIIIALVLLVVIYKFAKWAKTKFQQGTTTLQEETDF
jgi:Flp pilus assembly pilin Flp